MRVVLLRCFACCDVNCLDVGKLIPNVCHSCKEVGHPIYQELVLSEFLHNVTLYVDDVPAREGRGT